MHARWPSATAVMAVAKFERLFRLAAGVGVDKADLERYDDFINDRLYALLVRGAATAKANGRDVMRPWDVPITRGLQECIHAFGRIDQMSRCSRSSTSWRGIPRSMPRTATRPARGFPGSPAA